MTDVSTEKLVAATQPADPAAGSSPRIDGAHRIGDKPSTNAPGEAAGDLAAEVLAVASEATPQQQAQALQLAELLQARQNRLDEREAQLNAQSARFDDQQRFARLCQTQQEAEIAGRQEELADREADLEQLRQQLGRDRQDWEQSTRRQEEAQSQRLEELRQRELAADADRDSLTRQRASLQIARHDMERQRREQIRALQSEQQQLQLRIARLNESRRALQKQQEQHDHSRPKPEPRTTGLAADRKTMELLAEHRRKLIAEQQRLENERSAFQVWRDAERSKLDEEERNGVRREQERRSELTHRHEQLNGLQESLEATRQQVAEMHRETLETRLATQQLWSQVVAVRTPAELTQALAQIRLQLSQHYEEEARSLQERRRHVMELGRRLAAKGRNLQEKRRELRAWDAGRQKEVERQAAQLVAREHELRHQEESHLRLQADWHRERLDLQQQIRDLIARLEQG